MRKIDF